MPKLSQPRGGATPASNRPERIEAGGARVVTLCGGAPGALVGGF